MPAPEGDLARATRAAVYAESGTHERVRRRVPGATRHSTDQSPAPAAGGHELRLAHERRAGRDERGREPADARVGMADLRERRPLLDGRRRRPARADVRSAPAATTRHVPA